MQRDLWGNPVIKEAEYFVFHDESLPNKRWLLIGLLFVRTQNLEMVRDILREVRRQEGGYKGEIHFSKLPKSFGGAYGAKARVARGWMYAFQNGLHQHAAFTCLAVDRHSPAYEPKRFSKDFHVYNRFTAMALKAGIAWLLGPLKLEKLSIHFISDAKDRVSRPDQAMLDNFEDYIPYRARLDAYLARAQGKAFPEVNTDLELRDSADEDLLQFTDLLLGATQMAIVAGANKQTKQELGRMVVAWCQDLRKPPWKQEFQLYRKYNLWMFPDQRGRPSNHVPLSLEVGEGQLSFL